MIKLEWFNDKSGFTLIEIIVVLMITGILAAIALPNLFSNISKSRSAEAMSSISAERLVIDGCVYKNGGTSENVSCGVLVLGNPAATDNFTYVYTGPKDFNDTGYTIVASGKGAPYSRG